MQLSSVGELVHQHWLRIPRLRSDVQLDEFVVMPDHVHGVVVLLGNKATGDPEGRPCARTSGPAPGSLGAIIGQFKSGVVKALRDRGLVGGEPLWQRGYYERVIRDDRVLAAIREYIKLNPERW